VKIVAALLLLPLVSFAAPKPDDAYQDAVLKSFVTIPAGQNCHTSGSSTGTTDSAGNSNTSGNATTNCSDTMVAHYTIVIGEQTLVIQPTMSGKAKAGAAFSLGWSAVFAKNSCLYGQLPGAHIQIRADGRGVIVVDIRPRGIEVDDPRGSRMIPD
jgi:hypothetical protein